jgi:hypothetical protein
VVLISWRHPKQAVMLAASLGGYAGCTAGLAGGLAGALHGSAWVPEAWWSRLQDGQAAHAQQTQKQQQTTQEAAEEQQGAGAHDGGTSASGAGASAVPSKHDVVQLGRDLAALDCTSVPPVA